MEQTQEQTSMKLVGRIKPQRGHTLFKYETLTGRLIPMKNGTTGANTTRRVVIAEKDCIYVTALNLKNAIKKLAQYHGITVNLKEKKIKMFRKAAQEKNKVINLN